jgi:hypothetical protein
MYDCECILWDAHHTEMRGFEDNTTVELTVELWNNTSSLSNSTNTTCDTRSMNYGILKGSASSRIRTTHKSFTGRPCNSLILKPDRAMRLACPRSKRE